MSNFIVQKFYPAINSAALAKPFYDLNPPLFHDYVREIEQTWNGYQGKQLTGLHTDKAWGKPTLALTFGKLSRDEFAYLVSLKGPCTVFCRNEDINAFGNYNAILRTITAVTFSKSGNMYESVTATFLDLTAL